MRQVLHLFIFEQTRNLWRPSLVKLWMTLFYLCFGLILQAYPVDRIGTDQINAGQVSLTNNGYLHHAPIENSIFVCDADAGSITPTVNSICVEGVFANLSAIPDGNQIVPPGFTTTYLLTTGANSLILKRNGSPEFTVTTEGLYTIHTLIYDPITYEPNSIILNTTTLNEVNNQFEQGGGSICAALDMNGATILTEKAVGIIIYTTNENCDDADGTASVAPVSNTFEWPDGFVGNIRGGLTNGVYNITVTQSTGLGCTSILPVVIGENCGPGGSCTAMAGSISPNASPVCLDVSTTISATPSGNAVVPSGFITTYLQIVNGVVTSISNTPSFTVFNLNDYTIHTLIHDPSTLPLSSIIPNTTTAQQLNASLEQGGGAICGALDLTGATISVIDCNPMVCTASAGNLTVDASPVCLDGATVISVSPSGNAVIPTGYVTTYLQVVNGVISSISDLSSFTVYNLNNYSIHTLIHDPNEIPVNSIFPGTTTPQDINALLLQGGGSFCGALDLSGATVSVIDCTPMDCEADAGTLMANDDEVCLNVTANISLTAAGNAVVPSGFVTTYLQAVNGTITAISGSPSFTVFNANDYTIHTLVFDPSELPLNSIIPGTTTTQEINSQLEQGGGTICGSLDLVGAAVSVIVCGDPCTPPQIFNIVKTDSNCEQTTGTARINVAGNNANYTFAFSGGNISGNFVSGLPGGSYSVTITDITDPNCFTVENFIIGNADGPVATIISTSPTSCNAANGTAQLSPSNLNYTWCDGGTGDFRNGLSSGTCFVTVTDPNTGCYNMLEVNIPSQNLLLVDPIVNQQPDCGAANGIVVLSINGGSNDYTITWSDNAGANTNIRNDLAAGTYGVTVVDNGPNGCVGEAIFSLTENTSSTGTIDMPNTEVQVSCPGSTDGNVPYTLNLDPGFIQPVTEQIVDVNGNTFTNGSLPAGNYCLEVTDGSGCLALSQCFSVSQPDPLVVDVAAIATTCTQLGSIVVEVTGGSGNYNFDWQDLSGGSDPQNRNDLAAGNYNLVVTDGNGCIANFNNIIVANGCGNCQATSGSLIADMNQVVFDGINAVQISASQNISPIVPGGYSVFYVLTSGPGLEIITAGSSPSFSVSALGQYTIHTLVYNMSTLDPFQYMNGLDLNADLIQGGGTICAALDVTGATIQVVSDGSCQTPVISNIAVTEATCENSDGSITVSMAGASNYNFQWSSGGSSTNTITGLVAGTYSVTITDAGNPTCVLVETIVMGNANGPEISIFSQTPTSCNANNGTAVLEPQTLLFDWSDGTSGAIRTDLAPGMNIVTVTDPATNCINVVEIFIESINNLSIDIDISQQPSCGAADGSVTASATGGSTNYSYSWSDGGNGASRNNLAAGTYGLTVVDNGPNGCVRSEVFVLTNTVAGDASVIISDPEIQQSCAGANDASVDYTVNLSGGFTQPSTERIVDANGIEYTNGQLPAGEFCIEILDGSNCVAGGSCFEVIAVDPLLVQIEVDAKTCATGGAIRIEPSGGSGTYTYDWADLPNANDPQERSGLDAGTYAVVVSDGNGCVANFDNITVTDECSSGCDATSGSLTITANPVIFNGTDPVQISATQNVAPNVPTGYTVLYVLTSGPGLEIVNVNIAPSFEVSLFGQYTIHTLVYNSSTFDPTQYTNGLDLNEDLIQGGGTICAALDVTGALVQVISDGPCQTPVITSTIITEATCSNSDGSVTVQMADFSNYTFQWSQGSSTTNTNSGLSAGTYTATITDAGNPICVLVQTFVIGNSDGPEMTVFSQTPTSCNASNGTAVLEPQTNLFDWSDGISGAIRTNLAPGINIVTVTDPTTNCINVVEVFIESVNNLETTINISQQPTCGSADGAIEAVTTGGSTDYSYFWSDGGSTATRGNLSAGTYGLTVVDNGPNACRDSVYFILGNTVAGDATAIITNPIIQQSCAGGNDASVDYSVNLSATFIQPSTERIVDANGTQYTNGQLPPGNYCIEILDGSNCVAGGSCFEVVVASPLLVNVEVDPKTCTTDGGISLDVSRGSGIYTFDWEDLPNSSDPQNRVDLDAGLYNVTVSDGNGCEVIVNNILVSDECTVCPTSSEENVIVVVGMVETVPFEIESCFDAAQTTFVLLDGTTSGSSTYGSWIVDANGNLIYTANNTPGINVDTICVVANFNVLSDTTCYIVTITPECTGQDIIPDDLITLNTSDCVNGTSFCLPVPAMQIGNYVITDNGMNFDAGTTGCDFDTTYFYSLIDFLTNAPSGPYSLMNWTFNGNSFSIDTFQTISQLADSMNVWDTEGNWFLSGTIVTGGAPNVIYGQLQIEQITSGFSAVLDPELDTVNPMGTIITLDTGFHEMILTDLTTGCVDTVDINVLCDDCPDLYTGPSPLMIDDCDSLASVCLDVPISQIGNISVDGSPYLGTIEPCGFDTVTTCYSIFTLPGLGSAASGPYNLDLWDKSTGPIANAQFDSIQQLVFLLNGWDPTGNWTLDVATSTICGGTAGVTYGDMTITQLSSGTPTSLVAELDIFIFASAIMVDTGFHIIEINNTITGCSDVIELQVNCDLTPGTDTLVQVFVSQTDTLCFDFLDTIASVNTNLCPDLANGNVAGFNWLNGTNCVEYTGMVLGIDTFCVEFCFTNNTCETYNVIVEVVPELLSGDTVNVDVLLNFTEQFCIDTSAFLGNIDTIYNYCESSAGMFSEVSLVEPNCVNVIGNVVGGLDTACIVICDDFDVCDTTIFLINIIPPTPDTVMQIVEQGVDTTYCVDTTQLFGNIVSIDNFCESLSGTAVNFVPNSNTFCLDFQTLELGVDTACIEVCDDLGVCDTTIFIVEVVLPFDTLVAVDEDTMTSTINPVTIDVLANDIFSGDCGDLIFGILDGVDHGTLVINIDCTVTYLAEPGFCGERDSFIYFISNGTISDTATVTIDVLCDDIRVFNGFSPNDDGVNDNLMIQGIDNFPDNEVCLFNRWGNQVFRQKGYSNSEPWKGTFDGKDLPDGTYFYLIDDGEGNKYSGWIMILR